MTNYLERLSLNNRVAIVTGASVPRGIGGVVVPDHYMRTLQGHLPADFKADAAGTTGNENDLTCEIFHVASLSLLVVNVYSPGRAKSDLPARSLRRSASDTH